MQVNEFAKEVHELAVEKGWWEGDRPLPEIIALCHSELSESFEAYRSNEPMFYRKDGKPEGVATELADCVIRIFDYLYYRGINIEDLLTVKHDYNKTRSYRHGGKVA